MAVNPAVLNSMTDAEQRLVAETSRAALADLDEEELLDLQARIRRARSKYVTIYRRSAAGGVVKRGGRGFSYPKNQRDRDKAEVFEAASASGQQAGRCARGPRRGRAEGVPAGGGPVAALGSAQGSSDGACRRGPAASRARGAKRRPVA
jgi:hypothetical protein